MTTTGTPTNYQLGEYATVEHHHTQQSTGRIVYLEVWGALAGMPRQAAVVDLGDGTRILGRIVG